GGAPVIGPATAACEGKDSGDNEMWNGLVNGYVDLGNYGGFMPYVGAGVGLVFSNYSGSEKRTCADTSTTDGTGTTDFACDADQGNNSVDEQRIGFLWALSAGFGYQLSEYTALDVGYRYLSSPNATQLVNLPGGIDEQEGMSVHQVRVGLRYQIW
nr:outer membrane beta-barrel protein [Nitratireductor sp.]